MEGMRSDGTVKGMRSDGIVEAIRKPSVKSAIKVLVIFLSYPCNRTCKRLYLTGVGIT